MSTPSALVTGDVVLDCHLYGGVKTAATSFQEPGTVYMQHLGGADLSRKLLAAAADAKGLAWDAKRQEWERKKAERDREIAGRTEANAKLNREGGVELPVLQSLPWPEDLARERPQRSYDTHLGVDDSSLETSLPHLHSFGVWTPQLAKKGGKDSTEAVWRVQTHFGYGPTRSGGTAPPFRPAKGTPDPSVILVDDGGITFRHKASQECWRVFSKESPGSDKPVVVLKMSAPLCRGDLWPQLVSKNGGVANRLVVVVGAADLRREDSKIRQHLSWEQCAADALLALHEDPLAKQLLEAEHIVVNFGSSGALWLHRENSKTVHAADLILDPVRLEGDFSRDFDGSVYGLQTCLAVALAHHLMMIGARQDEIPRAIPKGIVSGLQARRRLLELGHGKVGKGPPGFPVTEIGKAIADDHGGFARATVPPVDDVKKACPWSILADSQKMGTSGPPYIGLALLTATFGRSALSMVPSLSKDKLFSVDRSEIESLRTLERLIREYETGEVQKKPLSIGVFGPPGAGKSFGVKALAKAILGEKVPVLEFNLSQFKGPEELIGAFHRVRDEVLKGTTPVAFWDEFDSQRYRWLQYLLAPMQDGAFQEGQITHPIGKCVFIFAGGTADSLERFGVREPSELGAEERKGLSGAEREDRIKEEDAYREFKLLKGPDFISRLHGHLDVLGPNPRKDRSPNCPDLTWPIRRALMLRGVLGLKDGPKKPDTLDMDAGLLFALLDVPEYKHGSRSFEKILLALAQDRHGGHFHRSALPPDPLLERETSAHELHERMNQRNAFKTHPDIERIAAAIHDNYRKNAKARGSRVTPEVDRPYEELAPDYRASNRAAAGRIPDLLALIDFIVVPNPDPSSASWQGPLKAQIAAHRERLAQAEHLGWNAERFANGWTFAPVRNDAQKQHNLLVDWANLSESDKNKDRDNMDAIPTWLELAGYMAVPVS